MNLSLIKEIKKISKKNPDCESCGFILKKNKKYTTVECSNVSSNSKYNFEIPDKEYIFAYKNYEIISIFHSHVVGDENLSNEDILIAEALDTPMIVYSLKSDKFKLFNPNRNPKDKINIFFEKNIGISV